MPVVYRIIKYEADTQDTLDYQLNNSIAPGFVCKVHSGLTITIKDRNDDPNELGFFDSCMPSPVAGMITRKQLEERTNKQLEQLRKTPLCQEQDQ